MHFPMIERPPSNSRVESFFTFVKLETARRIRRRFERFDQNLKRLSTNPPSILSIIILTLFIQGRETPALRLESVTAEGIINPCTGQFDIDKRLWEWPRDYRESNAHGNRDVYYYKAVSASRRVRRETVGQVGTPFLMPITEPVK